MAISNQGSAHLKGALHRQLLQEETKMRAWTWKVLWALAALCSSAICGSAQAHFTDYTFAPHEGDVVTHDFKVSDAQTLAEVRLHYSTLGTPQRDASGKVTNAVLILH